MSPDVLECIISSLRAVIVEIQKLQRDEINRQNQSVKVALVFEHGYGKIVQIGGE